MGVSCIWRPTNPIHWCSWTTLPPSNVGGEVLETVYIEIPDTPRTVYKKTPLRMYELVRVKLKPVNPPETTSWLDNTGEQTQPPNTIVVTKFSVHLVSPSEFYSYNPHLRTFKQLNLYPFTLFPKKKELKQCCKKKFKWLCHNSNFVKSRVNNRMC